jgi:hypothetical protein
VAEEGAIPDLNDARFPLHADFRAILQLRYELAQDIQVRSPVEQKQPLIIEHPRAAGERSEQDGPLRRPSGLRGLNRPSQATVTPSAAMGPVRTRTHDQANTGLGR